MCQGARFGPQVADPWTRISLTKKYTSGSNACFGVSQPYKVLDDESERNISLLLTTTIYHAPTVCFTR